MTSVCIVLFMFVHNINSYQRTVEKQFNSFSAGCVGEFQLQF